MATTWTNPAASGAKYADHVRVSEAGCTTGTEVLPAYQGVYNPATNYAAQVLATYQGVLYLSLQANNLGNVPGPNSAWWTQVVGLDLKNLAAVGVAIELPAGVIGAGASIQMYLLNVATGAIWRVPDWDQALTPGLAGQVLPGFAVPGPLGKLIALPNNVGQPCNVFLNGIPMSGLLQS